MRWRPARSATCTPPPSRPPHWSSLPTSSPTAARDRGTLRNDLVHRRTEHHRGEPPRPPRSRRGPRRRQPALARPPRRRLPRGTPPARRPPQARHPHHPRTAPPRRRNTRRRALNVVDATCPLVTKVHAEARRFAGRGDTILLIGHAGHEEVEGTLGEAPGQTILVQSAEEAGRVEVPDSRQVSYLTQTTLSV